MESFAIVFNPSKISREALETSLHLSDDEASAASWFETEQDDPGRGMARQALADGATLVIAAGGDGTVRAVAEVLAGSGTPMGIVPQGTGNLLARNLGLPLNRPAEAFRRAVDGEPGGIDVAWLEHDGGREAFVVLAGFGVDAQMLEETDDELKAKIGWVAYVEAMGRAVSGATVVEMRLSVDGGDEQVRSAHTVMIANCGTLQGGVQLLPDAAPDDGVLDLLVLSADNAGGWLDTLKTMAWDHGVMRLFRGGEAGTEVSSDSVGRFTATEVSVRLDEARLVQIDGDPIGELQEFTVRVDPQALLVSR